jgi:hypothetical protein
MKTLQYIAVETHFTAGKLIWLGKMLEIIINPSSGESTLFSMGTAQSMICKIVQHIYANESSLFCIGCNI